MAGCSVETSVETSSGGGAGCTENAASEGRDVRLQLRVMGLYCCVTAVTRGAFASSSKLALLVVFFLRPFRLLLSSAWTCCSPLASLLTLSLARSSDSASLCARDSLPLSFN